MLIHETNMMDGNNIVDRERSKLDMITKEITLCGCELLTRTVDSAAAVERVERNEMITNEIFMNAIILSLVVF